MSDLPILFSAPMVRAILREIEQPGTGKTQTRRVINPQPKLHPHHEPVRVEKRGERGWVWMVHTDRPAYQFATGDWKAPYAVGDRLWVREAWHAARSLDSTPPRDIPRVADIEYAATARSYAEIGLKGKLRPSMFLPRWASRITLIVTDVRAQRLQEISEADAVAEGLVRLKATGRYVVTQGDQHFGCAHHDPRKTFRDLWDGINAGRGYGWDANPWVAAYTFRPILGNIDQVQL